MEVRRWPGHAGKVYCVHFSPDGKTLVSGSEKEAVFRLWDVATGKERAKFQRKKVNGGAGGRLDGEVEGRVSAVAFSPDGRLLGSAHDQRLLPLWDVETATQLRALQGHEAIVHGAAFSPDGKFLLSGGVDRTVRLWDVESGEQVRSFGSAADAVKCVAFSPDGLL